MNDVDTDGWEREPDDEVFGGYDGNPLIPWVGDWLTCPRCGSGNIDYHAYVDGTTTIKCNECGARGG